MIENKIMRYNYFRSKKALTTFMFLSARHGCNSNCFVRGMVSLHGEQHNYQLSPLRKFRTVYNTNHDRTHMLIGDDKPVDPNTLLTNIDESVEALSDWWYNKKQVLVLTGAGISTESGIPDYRGHKGSYHSGHKPIVHDQFMKSEYHRKRYWGRGMVGWRYFDQRQPSTGHYALAQLEQMGKIGVQIEDHVDFHENDIDYHKSTGFLQLSTITQNVDTLHRRAGTKYLLELHGRTDRLSCMNCGASRERRCFHEELEELNVEWLRVAREAPTDLRADGDASIRNGNYEQVQIPSCDNCGVGFYKPDVVFFGDTVPIHRVKQCQAAVEVCDGLLVVGSSLAVHSAFRHIRTANKLNIPIAILNVGPTRAEQEGIDVLKIEAPAGPTLEALVNVFTNGQYEDADACRSIQ